MIKISFSMYFFVGRNDLKSALGEFKLNSRELNIKLIQSLPILKNKYDDEISWQEGDDTGSHTVFGNVLTPYLVECISLNKQEKIIEIFNILEDLLNLHDSYTDEVIALSVFESILYIFEKRTDLVELLGKESRNILNNFT